MLQPERKCDRRSAENRPRNFVLICATDTFFRPFMPFLPIGESTTYLFSIRERVRSRPAPPVFSAKFKVSCRIAPFHAFRWLALLEFPRSLPESRFRHQTNKNPVFAAPKHAGKPHAVDHCAEQNGIYLLIIAEPEDFGSPIQWAFYYGLLRNRAPPKHDKVHSANNCDSTCVT